MKIRSSVEPAVAVGIFEDQHAVAQREVEVLRSVGVRVVLGDPEPPARVPGHGDGVLDVGLGGEDRDAEPRRHTKPCRSIASGHGRRGSRLGISRSGRIIRDSQAAVVECSDCEKGEEEETFSAHARGDPLMRDRGHRVNTGPILGLFGTRRQETSRVFAPHA